MILLLKLGLIVQYQVEITWSFWKLIKPLLTNNSIGFDSVNCCGQHAGIVEIAEEQISGFFRMGGLDLPQ